MDEMRRPGKTLGCWTSTGLGFPAGVKAGYREGAATAPHSHPLPNLAHPNPAATASPVYAPPTKSTTIIASSHAPPLWNSKGHVRRFLNLLLTLDVACAALQEHGIDFEVRRHKGSSPQSHGRWALVGKHFNIHPGFKNNDSKRGPPVDTVVEGRKGFDHAWLDTVARALQARYLL